jgi:ABC-2 type transport system permease protein
MTLADSNLTVNPWRAAGSLAAREMLRFVRQRNRVFGALGQPILFWLLFGAGLGPTFRMSPIAADSASPGYAEYFFPGTLALILLFTAIFATISIIEDRREGFLQGVLVSPAPAWSMVLGKLLGASMIATAQGLVFLALGPTLGLRYTLLGVAEITLLMFVMSMALSGLGFVIAWRMDSTQGFHAIMNVFLMPMWLLSGAFFPIDAGPLRWVAIVNPMTYGLATLRRLLYAGDASSDALAHLPALTTGWWVTIGFAALTFVVACRMASRPTKGDLL